MNELSKLPPKKSVWWKELLKTMARELGPILLAAILNRLRPGVARSAPGATRKQALPNPGTPGAQPSSPTQE